MGIKDVLQKIGENSRNRKEKIKALDEQIKLSKLVQDRMKSSNRRELERYYEEDEEARIKEELEYMRKKRQQDISFGHNPIDVKNITNHTDWNVLKERNQFAGGKTNMFKHKGSVLKGDRNLLKSHMRLIGK